MMQQTRGSQRSAVGDAKQILTINCGSSSLKFALYLAHRSHVGDWREEARYTGAVENIGADDGHFHVTDSNDQSVATQAVALRDHSKALHLALDWLEQRMDGQVPDAVGHRIVHGGSAYEQPQRITPDVIETLRHLAPLAPLHMPI